MNRRPLLHRCLILLLALSTAAAARAQSPPPAAADVPASTPAELPSGFLIGPDDVLSIVFWRDKDMTAQVTVRPDGNISLPLLNDVRAAGLTPAELRARLIAESKRYFDNPNVTVIVNQINSRKVFITGQIVKPGAYTLTAPTTVLQLISLAGGLKDFADSRRITIVRRDGAHSVSLAFNYKDIGRNLHQNIDLRPGDTVIVP
jgi:polysaccharide export outer membrane protein